MTLTRRAFLELTAAGGSALVLGFDVFAQAATDFAPNAWVRIDPNGVVTLTVGKVEMGQGVRTSLPMILAEELDADWERIQLVQGMPSAKLRGLGTGGSYSIRAMWMPLRNAAAAAREMLVSAAASKLGVEPASLRTEKGFVIHDATGQRLSYGELTTAAAKLPLPQSPKLKEKFTLVGKRTKRIEGQSIVSGKAVYGLDVRIPDMLYASIERPPKIGGGVRRFDAAKAKQVAGVIDVVQVSRGVAVIARDSWAALRGREALQIEFDNGPHPAWSSEEYEQQLFEAAAKDGISTRTAGDSKTILGSGKQVIEADYVYPFYAHAPVEPMNTVAHVHDGLCEIWSSTQAPNDVQDRCAQLLGIAPEKVSVHTTLVGGGFGRRLGWDYALDAVEVAKAIGKPVMVFWSRADDMQHGYFQAPSVHRMKAVLDEDGLPVLWHHRKVSTYHNARRQVTSAQLQDPEYHRGVSWGVYDVPYAIGAIETAYVYVPTHVPIGPWRAVFAPSSVFARETFFDELAVAGKRDPLKLRLDLLAAAPEIVEAGSLKISRPRLRRVLETVAAKGRWGEKLPKGRGRGLACNVYDGVTHVAYVVDVTAVKGKIRVDKVVCAIDCGLVVNPIGIEQQVEGGVIWGLSSALKGAITIRDGIVQQKSFADFEVLRMNETPLIETHIVGADAPSPYGVGEPTVAPIVPALVNAIYAATGKRVRRLPLA
ncbi:MAG TPA: molybdopterin cofactor-binding domain-containing protein [Thermoanaerobaculia bacterium]|nr:molybdopterin cofactor-binding domain-containing protein [Thermoanaerobaculia bacterium]